MRRLRTEPEPWLSHAAQNEWVGTTSGNKATAALNLVSLMDIFTILVFFLLVNSSEVEVLPNDKGHSVAGVDC